MNGGGSFAELRRRASSLLPPDAAVITTQQQPQQQQQENDVNGRRTSLSVEQLLYLRAATSRRHSSAQHQFVSPSVRLSRLKSKYLSQRQQHVTASAADQWYSHLPQRLSLIPAALSSSPRDAKPRTGPDLVTNSVPPILSDECDSGTRHVKPIPTVVIMEADDEHDDHDHSDIGSGKVRYLNVISVRTL